MNLRKTMKGSRLKVKRADSLIEEIIRDSSPLSKNLYKITNGPERSVAILAKPDRFSLTYRPKEPITEHFGSIMGDAVNNLRESLDYWMNAAARVVGPPKKLHFPFSEEWKYLEVSSNYIAVQKAFPDAAKFILENIEPCRDTNLYLWAATSLCNFNHHNDFLPTVTIVNVDNINARVGTNTVKNCAVGGNANRPIGIIRSNTPIAIENNFSTSVGINFPKGAIFENQPVIPTLTQMSQVVSETLDALEVFIRPYTA